MSGQHAFWKPQRVTGPRVSTTVSNRLEICASLINMEDVESWPTANMCSVYVEEMDKGIVIWNS